MKGFNVEKIANVKVAPESFWYKADDTKIKLETSELEDMFGVKETPAAEGAAAGGDKEKKKEAVILIDAGKSQNLSIILSRFKMTPQAICEAILSLDTTKLDVNQVRALLKYPPTSDEMQALREYDGDKANLALGDAYFAEAIKMSKYEERLKAMAYRLTFEEQLADVVPDIERITNAAKAVRDSPGFKKLLEVTLALSNYINGGGFRGGLYAFQLKSMTKLRDTRSNKKGITLLHYLVQKCQKEHPECLTFTKDFEAVPAASKIQKQNLLGNFGNLKKGFNDLSGDVQKFVAENIKNGDADKFVEIMQPYTADLTSRFEKFEAMLAEMESTLESVFGFYLEDPKKTQPEEFLGTVAEFIADWDKAIDELKQMAAKEEKEKKAAEAKAGGGDAKPAQPKAPAGKAGAKMPGLGDKKDDAKPAAKRGPPPKEEKAKEEPAKCTHEGCKCENFVRPPFGVACKDCYHNKTEHVAAGGAAKADDKKDEKKDEKKAEDKKEEKKEDKKEEKKDEKPGEDAEKLKALLAGLGGGDDSDDDKKKPAAPPAAPKAPAPPAADDKKSAEPAKPGELGAMLAALDSGWGDSDDEKKKAPAPAPAPGPPPPPGAPAPPKAAPPPPAPKAAKKADDSDDDASGADLAGMLSKLEAGADDDDDDAPKKPAAPAAKAAPPPPPAAKAAAKKDGDSSDDDGGGGDLNALLAGLGGGGADDDD